MHVLMCQYSYVTEFMCTHINMLYMFTHLFLISFPMYLCICIYMCVAEYKDWWIPKVEEITIDKDRAKKQGGPSSAPSALDAKVSCL